jgi:predicted dinucleotide-binding enzyme
MGAGSSGNRHTRQVYRRDGANGRRDFDLQPAAATDYIGPQSREEPMLKSIVAVAQVIALVALSAPAAAQSKPQEKVMKETVAVIGTGRMGGAFGANFSALGHTVIYGSREPGKASVKEVVGKTKGASAMTPKEAAAKADIVVLAVPWTGIEETVKSLGDLSGKLVLDPTNALKANAGAMEMVVPTSGGEMIQQWLPKATVVKAFNTVGFFVIANPKVTEGPVAVFLAGDDAAAKARVSALVGQMGFDPVDVGPMKNARVLESMSILYMVPYMGGKMDQTFEWAVRSTGKRAAGPVRPAQ